MLCVCREGAMAVAVAAAAAVGEARPELVGKRFLCVSGDAPPELGHIAHWPWRAGVIRAVSHRDSHNSELTVGSAGFALLRGCNAVVFSQA